MERRSCNLELRTVGDFPHRLEGYAAVFGTETRIGDFVETIRAGAFKDTLASGRDILALADHDPRALLGRTRSGTLRLAEDTRGLHFEIDTADTSLGRDIHELVKRGDIGGASFGFKAKKDFWNGRRRELRAVDLYEISIVQSFPAYQDTSVEARAEALFAKPEKAMQRVARIWRA
jgi:HK97 family phage prohead protease